MSFFVLAGERLTFPVFKGVRTTDPRVCAARLIDFALVRFIRSDESTIDALTDNVKSVSFVICSDMSPAFGLSGSCVGWFGFGNC